MTGIYGHNHFPRKSVPKIFEKPLKIDVAKCVSFLVHSKIFVLHLYCNRLHHRTFEDIYKFLFKNY